MSGSARPGVGVPAGQTFTASNQPQQFMLPENHPLANYQPIQKLMELSMARNGMSANPSGAANVFRPQMNAQLPQGMPNYEQLMQQNMLQGQQRIQNVPNMRGFFGSQE